MANSGAPPRRHFLPRPSSDVQRWADEVAALLDHVTLDGCVDHAGSGVIPDQELHERSAETIAAADALIFGRITYQMMEEAWRPVAAGEPADWVEDWMRPSRAPSTAPRSMSSPRLERVDWNAEIIRPADLEATVRKLKAQAGGRLHTAGPPAPHPRPTRTGRRVRVRRIRPSRAVAPRLLDGLPAPLPLTSWAHRPRLRRRRPPVCRAGSVREHRGGVGLGIGVGDTSRAEHSPDAVERGLHLRLGACHRPTTDWNWLCRPPRQASSRAVSRPIIACTCPSMSPAMGDVCRRGLDAIGVDLELRGHGSSSVGGRHPAVRSPQR